MDNEIEHPDEIIKRAVSRAARALEDLGGDMPTKAGIGEIKHLQPALVAVMRERFGERAWPNAKIAIPGWSNVGHVDLVLRERADDPAITLAIEVKSEKIDEGLWDLFKMALLATRSDVGATYLITSATQTNWTKNCCRKLFEGGTYSPIDLCELRYPSGRFVWDWMLEGGWDKHPEHVPLEIETRVAAAERLSFGSDPWEIRALRVASSGSERVPFPGGWPNGNRPPDAKHPLVPG
jgi:hypothetical protein